MTAFFAVCVWIVRLRSSAGRLKAGRQKSGDSKSCDSAFGNMAAGGSGSGSSVAGGSASGKFVSPAGPVNIRLIVAEELMFLAVLIIWVYFIGFHPDVTGTEKPMDYGFMAALDRSTEMPAKDIWYGTDPINYYYGGQYFSVYFAKLAFTEVKYAYNMMRALIAALVFVMPFSIVRQLLIAAEQKRSGTGEHLSTAEQKRSGAIEQLSTTEQKQEIRRGARVTAALGGLLASAAVACAGNLHYVLYGLFGKVFRPYGWQDYWFPESTRFIGHNPPTDDACIHEFPSYSFVLGDMHAHMINLIFVLLFLGILTAWMLEIAARRDQDADKTTADRTDSDASAGAGAGDKRKWIGRFRELFSPHLLLLAAMTGMFKWTNYWDFIIYLTVLLLAMGILLIQNVCRGASLKQELIRFAARLALIWLVGKIAAYPFTSGFKMMVSEVAFAKSHTAFYQFMILWGLPVVTFLLYVAWLFRRWHHAGRFFAEKHVRNEIPMPYLAAFLFGICALGLILIPEIVYVKDIYEEGFSRSNTMFKLTYQAFVMFGLFFGFALPEMLLNRFGRSISVLKLLTQEIDGRDLKLDSVQNVDTWDSESELTQNTEACNSETKLVQTAEACDLESESVQNSAVQEVRPVQIAAGVLTALLLLTVGYLPYSVKCWFGNVLDPSGFLGMDATAFLEDVYPEDAAAIRWLDANLEGQPVVLETWGDSYSEDCRVSAFTGIPTVQGWYVHEWLWRMDLDTINARVDDVNAIFMTTSDPADLENARELLRKYNVKYVFVGSCERMKYPTLDEDALKMLGTVVYEEETGGTASESGSNPGTFIVRVDN